MAGAAERRSGCVYVICPAPETVIRRVDKVETACLHSAPAPEPCALQEESFSQMIDVRLSSAAATVLRTGAPLGAPDTGDLRPS